MAVKLRHPGKIARQLAYVEAHRDAAKARGDAEALADLERRAEALAGMLARAHRCRHCGRPLEDPVSVARGIGSTCWAKGAR
jgi:hypothetical protein